LPLNEIICGDCEHESRAYGKKPEFELNGRTRLAEASHNGFYRVSPGRREIREVEDFSTKGPSAKIEERG
jgi:hypothetical protein